MAVEKPHIMDTNYEVDSLPFYKCPKQSQSIEFRQVCSVESVKTASWARGSFLDTDGLE
jgi:hypothetical protein